MKHPTPSVIVLIVINSLLLVVTEFVPGMKERLFSLLALHFPSNEAFQPWQLVTHMFMHGHFPHLLLNMFGLYMFGGALERIWGTRRFLTFYFTTGIGAGLIFTATHYFEFNGVYNDLIAAGVSPDAIRTFLETRMPTQAILSAVPMSELEQIVDVFYASVVGASGAIYGILVAFALLFPNAKLMLIFFPVPIAAKWVVPGLLLLDLFSGVTGFSLFGGGIAHFAHIGGAIIGFAMMLYWRRKLTQHRYYYN